MDKGLLVSLAGFAFISSATPGPNNLLLVSSAALYGWRRTLPLLAGILLGFAILLGSANLGLGSVVARWPIMVSVVRIFGAAWLAWLAIRFFMAATRHNNPGMDHAALGRPLRFYEGVLFQWINPKALVLALSSAGAYIALADSAILRTMLIVGAFFVAGLVSCTTWMFAGDVINRYMSSGRSARYINITMGVLLLLTAVQILAG